MRPSLLLAVLLSAPALAQQPEIQRAAVPAQPIGVLHSLRTIPEACIRVQGKFTGDAANPYAFQVVRTSAHCQPRARAMDAAKANPSTATGWVLNDVLRVPSAACASQVAVLRVWRKAGSAAPPQLDAQGRARMYLQDQAAQAAHAKQLAAAMPAYAIATGVEGQACR